MAPARGIRAPLGTCSSYIRENSDSGNHGYYSYETGSKNDILEHLQDLRTTLLFIIIEWQILAK